MQRNDAQYALDFFAKKTQLSMVHFSPHDRFVHLYINRLYWDMYDISEKINDNFLEAYLGGKYKDYDVITTTIQGESSGLF